MSVLPVGFGSSGGLQITNSVRLRAAASAYFSRTPGVAGNRKTWTWSGWVKRGALATAHGYLLTVRDATPTVYGYIRFDTLDALDISLPSFPSTANNRRVTTAVYRDPSAHLHVVVAVDTTLATATDRIKLWVSGVQITSFSTNSSGTQNDDLGVNASGIPHYLGRYVSDYLDGYLSDVYFIDGQALTPSSFGETNSDGVWVPKAYTGTYGTNGFHLDFKDAALTAGSNVGLGKDVSGNGNYWTTNNISVTAGVTYDSMVDTPTNNYATLNPIQRSVTGLSDAALKHTLTGTSSATGTINVTSGKWYWETTITNLTGIMSVGAIASTYQGADNSWSTGDVVSYRSSGDKYGGGAGAVAYGATYTTNDIIGVALDMDTGDIEFFKNNSSQGIAYSTWIAGKTLRPLIGGNTTAATAHANFGQRPFTYTPPTGFKALCTANRTGTITVSGTFTGNAAADGPFVWIGGVPTVLTINGNAVTFGTHADKTAGGFKLRTASASYNASGSNTWTATATMNFGTTNLAPAPAQGNP